MNREEQKKTMTTEDEGFTKEDFEVELKKNYAEGSLLSFLLSTVNRPQEGLRNSVAEVLVDLHNTGEIDIFDQNQWVTFEKEGNVSFFQFQRFFHKILPELSAHHQSVMYALNNLVQLGGSNDAFIEWCRKDEKRALSILEDARHGNQLALEHLTCALVSGNYFDEAKAFLESDYPEARIRGVASMRWMSLSVSQETEANTAIISALEECDEPDLTANLYAAAFAIAEKSDIADVSTLKTVAELSAKHLSPTLQSQAARSLFRNANILDQDCLDAIMKLLGKIDPQHIEIFEILDIALSALLEAGFLDTVLDLLENLVSMSSGEISVEQFEDFFRKISEDDSTLARVALRWFSAGDLSICTGFANLLSENAQLDIKGDDLPVEHEDLVFICRKVVGHLFMKPIVAASFLLSVIKHSDANCKNVAAELLFEPLLISYGGKLKEYLEAFCADTEVPATDVVQKMLDRKAAYLKDLEGIETLVELHPCEEQRQAARAHWDEAMRKSTKEAEQNSILQHIPKSYLLYGRSLITFVEDPDGSTRKIEAPMGEMSFEIEHPSLDVIDPVGLQILLFSFKAEKKVNQ